MIRVTVFCIVLLAQPSLAEVRHLPAPRAQVCDDMGFAMIFQEMAHREDLLHAANLSPQDEGKAAAIVADFESRFRELSDALDQGVLTRRQFGEQRDKLARITRAKLRAALSPPGSIRLEKFVREQIARIRANAVQPQEV